MFDESDLKSNIRINMDRRSSTIRFLNLPSEITMSQILEFLCGLGYGEDIDEHSIKTKIDSSGAKHALVTFRRVEAAREIIDLHEKRLIDFPSCTTLDMKLLAPIRSNASEDEKLPSDPFHRSNSSKFNLNENDLSKTSLDPMNNSSAVREQASVVYGPSRYYPDNCSIYVGRVAPEMKDALRSLFSAYGRLRQPDDVVILGTNHHFAFINFCAPDSAKAVLDNRDCVYLNGAKLLIKPKQRSQRTENGSDKPTDESSAIKIAEGNSVLLLTEVAPNVTKSQIRAAFKVFGHIIHPPGIIIQRNANTATIPYSSSTSINRALRCTNGSLVLASGHKVNVLPYNKPEGANKESGACFMQKSSSTEVETTPFKDYLQIRNVNSLKSSPSDLLQKYLRNEKRSGGGEIDDFIYDKLCDRVLVKFRDPSSSARVLEKKLGHQLEDITLYVTKLPPLSTKHVYLHHIPERISKYELERYAVQIVDSKITDLKFRYDNGGAMIEFEDAGSVDIESVKDLLDVTPLKHLTQDDPRIEPLCVYESDSILVRGQVPSIDALSLALEDFLLPKVTNCIDCSVRYVIDRPDGQLYWVIFEDYRCVKFFTDNLIIENLKVSVSKFYDHLGFISGKDQANFLRTYNNSKYSVPLTDLHVRYLKNDKNTERFKNLPAFKKWTFLLMLDHDAKELKIISTADKINTNIANTIKSKLKPIVIALDDSMSKLLVEKYQIFDEEMNRFFAEDYAYEVNDATLTIVTSETQKMYGMLESFFNKNVSITEKLNRNVLEYKYLKRNQTAIQNFANDCHIIWSDVDQSVSAKGSLTALKDVRQCVDEFLTQNQTERLSFSKNGVPTYFRSAKGQKEVQGLEDLTGAVIMDAQTHKIDFDNIASSARSQLKGCRLSGKFKNLKVLVVCEDMTEQMVDCIINASNNSLQHMGGLAADLLAKAGSILQDECLNHVKKRGPLKTGDVFASGPGELKCKKVIHAVGPRYDGGHRNEESLLQKAVLNSMQEANHLEMKSIAVPAISSSIFGFPVQKAVPLIVDACLSFDHKSLTEIRFVDINMQTIDIFIEKLKSLPDFKLTSEMAPKNVIVSSMKIKSESNKCIPEVVVLKSTGRTAADKLMINGSSLEIIKDSIVNVAKDFDVIVNSTGSKLLSGGACSQSIISASGQALIDDVNTKYPMGMSNITLAATVAGDLPCKRIFHISCVSPWVESTSVNELKTKIIYCLDEAVKLKMNSIAFPAIGTGGLGFPPEKVAPTMIEIIQSHMKVRSSVKKIAIVVFPGDPKCVKCFEDEFQTKLKDTFVDTIDLRIGNLTVQIAEGQLENENTEAIICPSNSDVDLSYGRISCDLVTATGPNVLRKLLDNSKRDKKHPVHILNVFRRTKLKISDIIFVDVSRIKSKDEYLSLIEKTFYSANERLFKCISMPLYMTVDLDLHANILDLTLRAFQTFVSQYDGQCSLEKVRILLLPDLNVLQSVRDYFDNGNHSTLIDSKNRHAIMKEIFKKALASRPNAKPIYKNKPAGLKSPAEVPLCFAIYGTSKQINEAETLLIQLCDESWPQKVIHNSVIEKLGNSEITYLQMEAQKLNIEMTVHRDKCEIRVRGSDVDDFSDLLRGVLKQMADHIICHSDAKWYKKSAQNPDWVSVNSGIGALELAYKSRKENPTSLRVFEGNERVTVDMKNMLVRNAVGRKICSLKRKESHDNLPVEWDWQEGDNIENATYNLVRLTSDSGEYRTVRDAALRTSPTLTILEIERVENPTRFQQYALAKKQVEKIVRSGQPCERMLFHGTAPNHVPGICAGCFDRSLSGVNGVVYGQGSYFHKDFSYSYQYGRGKTIFYCNVLTGNYCVGDPNMKTAPDFDAKNKIRYDSTVDDINDPSIFVVYSDNHAYPSYLITCS